MSLPDRSPALDAAYEKLFAAALDEAAEIDGDALLANRQPASGIFLYDQANLLGLGADVARTDDGYRVAVHLPDINAYAPTNSAIDDLLHHAGMHGRGLPPDDAAKLWTQHLGSDADSVPALSVSFDVIQDDELWAIGSPTAAKTAVMPTYKHTRDRNHRGGPDKKTPEEIAGCIGLANRLVAQRIRLGALSVYGTRREDGHNRYWTYDQADGRYRAAWQSTIIRGELSKAAGASVGTLLAEVGVPALYSHVETNLTPEDVQRATEQYFKDSFAAYRTYQGGPHYYYRDKRLSRRLHLLLGQRIREFHPFPVKPNIQTHGKYYTRLTSAKSHYSDLVNLRVLEAASHGRLVQNFGELAMYTNTATELQDL